NYLLEMNNSLKKDEVIVLVGLSEKQIEKLPENIIGISRTDSVKELAEIYSAADVFVNPTVEDNFPTTNIEALACGTPVITFNTGGSPEVVDKYTGIVIEQGNIEELYAEILKIKNKGKKIYTESCINRSKRLYNKNMVFLKYIETYNLLFS